MSEAKSAGQPSFFTDLLLTGPARLFGAIASLRGSLYASGTFKSHRVAVPVISIGNITAGGTGKTPITSYLAQEITARGFSCGIVSRGYGAEDKGPSLVAADGSTQTAKRFGDEPSWLAATHPSVPVVIGGDRVGDIETLLALKKVDLILADDAFQHRRLKRDIDIVIVDATEPQWHYRPLPLGRMRESFEALARANYVFISKTNQASETQLAWIRGRIEQLRARYGFRVVEFEATLAGFTLLASSVDRRRALGANAVVTELNPFSTAGNISRSNLVLLSAIARPQVFEDMVRSQTGAEIVEAFRYRDHHAFTKEDLERVEARALQAKARAIIVTEKDATKLDGWRPAIPCYVSRLVAKPAAAKSPRSGDEDVNRSALEELYEDLNRLVR